MKYEPFWDELPYDGWEEAFDYYPFSKDTDFYPYDAENLYFSIREFHVVEPLDEHRFIYSVSSWEWNSGYGIYDLETRINHRITAQGNYFGRRGDEIFGQAQRTDINTYESSPLPETVQKLLKEAAEWMTSNLVYCDISPDGSLMATSGMKARYADKNLWMVSMQGKEPVYREASTVSVTDMRTGEIVRDYDIYNPFAQEDTVSFYDGTRFMLFCRPRHLGSAYIYLFDLEE